MGYGMTQAAAKSLETIKEVYGATTAGSNEILMKGGLWGFFEESRKDQPDGGICGTVRRELKASEHAYWKERGHETEGTTLSAGSFKISGDGKVVRFPGIPVAEFNRKFVS